VKAFVPVRIRLVTPIFDGPKFADYRSKSTGWLLTLREPPDANLVSRVRVSLAKPRICDATCPSDLPKAQLHVAFGPNRIWCLRWPSSASAGDASCSTARKRWDSVLEIWLQFLATSKIRQAVERGLSGTVSSIGAGGFKCNNQGVPM